MASLGVTTFAEVTGMPLELKMIQAVWVVPLQTGACASVDCELGGGVLKVPNPKETPFESDWSPCSDVHVAVPDFCHSTRNVFADKSI
jgi:hypothetical protein